MVSTLSRLSEPSTACLMLWPAVQARRTGPRIAATEVEAELRCYHHPPAERSEGLTDEFFVCVWAVMSSTLKGLRLARVMQPRWCWGYFGG